MFGLQDETRRDAADGSKLPTLLDLRARVGVKTKTQARRQTCRQHADLAKSVRRQVNPHLQQERRSISHQPSASPEHPSINPPPLAVLGRSFAPYLGNSLHSFPPRLFHPAPDAGPLLVQSLVRAESRLLPQTLRLLLLLPRQGQGRGHEGGGGQRWGE